MFLYPNRAESRADNVVVRNDVVPRSDTIQVVQKTASTVSDTLGEWQSRLTSLPNRGGEGGVA